MKKTLTKSFSFLAAVLLTVSCNNQPSKMDGAAAGRDIPSQGMVIAYVNMDSVQNNYNLYTVINDSLQTMDQRRQNILTEKAKQLERSANSIQTRLQNNGFTSEQQYKNAMAAFQQEQNNLAALEQRLNKELEEKALALNKVLHDSLDAFLTDYNKDKKFDFILRNEVVLKADPKFDITQDVINGLNARYKK